jgi:hypothetical protein
MNRIADALAKSLIVCGCVIGLMVMLFPRLGSTIVIFAEYVIIIKILFVFSFVVNIVFYKREN